MQLINRFIAALVAFRDFGKEKQPEIQQSQMCLVITADAEQALATIEHVNAALSEVSEKIAALPEKIPVHPVDVFAAPKESGIQWDPEEIPYVPKTSQVEKPAVPRRKK